MTTEDSELPVIIINRYGYVSNTMDLRVGTLTRLEDSLQRRRRR